MLLFCACLCVCGPDELAPSDAAAATPRQRRIDSAARPRPRQVRKKMCCVIVILLIALVVILAPILGTMGGEDRTRMLRRLQVSYPPKDRWREQY